MSSGDRGSLSETARSGLAQKFENTEEGQGDTGSGQRPDQGDAITQRESAGRRQEDGGDQKAAGAQKAAEQPSQFDRSLRMTDIYITVFAGLSFLASAISAAVAVWTASQMAGTAGQTERAIGKLATLADQTKRQADATAGQLTVLRDQVGEQRKQTKAIAEQTDAIRASANAAIQTAGAQILSAQAQTKAAEIAADAQKPILSMQSLTLSGLNGNPDADGRIAVTLDFNFQNTGGTSVTQKLSYMYVIADTELPEVPNWTGGYQWGSNDFVVGPGQSFHIAKPLKFHYTKEEVGKIRDNKKTIFVYGVLHYDDVRMKEHVMCFAFATLSDDPKSDDIHLFAPVGGPAYHCET